MRQARARGGSFWYCPHSRGRAVTLEMAKKFLGDDAAREIWVRSEYQFRASETPCPSCTRPMRAVTAPGWMGGGEIDICRGCHFVWLDPGERPQVPQPEDLITPQGDSTLLKDRAEGVRELWVAQEAEKQERESMTGSGPEGFLASLPPFFGLPAEMSNRAKPSGVWFTLGFITLMVVIQVFSGRENSSLVTDFGFYPERPFLNFGLNIFTSTILHGGWFHLLFNLYFFSLFSDDVEEDLGVAKYLGLFGFSAIAVAVTTVFFSGDPTLPHVGLSGVVMAFMGYYALQFPRARLAYVFPVMHSIGLGKGQTGWVRAVRWFRIPVWTILFVYVAKDFVLYWIGERTQLTSTSHSAHLGGAAAGVLYWFFVAKRSQDSHIRRQYTAEREIAKIDRSLPKLPRA